METIKAVVSGRIREARKDKGLTQKEVGERMGVSESTVNQYESGKQNLTIETLQKLADAVGVNIKEFF